MQPNFTILRFHPQLLITAARTHLGGAIRLWTLAKNVNSYGWMFEGELKSAASEMGISKSSFYKWLKDAKEAGFFTYFCDKQGRHGLTVASYATVYDILEVEFVDKQSANIPAVYLFSRGWMTFVWEAWNVVNVNGKVISQDTKQKLSGMPVSTQRRHDKRARIKRIRNYAITNRDTSNVSGFKEFSNKRGIFTIGKRVAFCIPSISVVTPSQVVPVGSKRLRRNIAKVRSYSNAETGDVKRLFFTQEPKYRKSEGDAYLFQSSEGKFNVWQYAG